MEAECFAMVSRVNVNVNVNNVCHVGSCICVFCSLATCNSCVGDSDFLSSSNASTTASNDIGAGALDTSLEKSDARVPQVK